MGLTKPGTEPGQRAGHAEHPQARGADPKQVADFYAPRKRNEADVKFCWK
jgi:hypothetical protein